MKTVLELWTCFVLLIVYPYFILGHMTEILVEDDIAETRKGNSLEYVPADEPVGGACHVEFQVMKRVLGRCVKLGHDSRGCVAGTYLHPFHPECI